MSAGIDTFEASPQSHSVVCNLILSAILAAVIALRVVSSFAEDRLSCALLSK